MATLTEEQKEARAKTRHENKLVKEKKEKEEREIQRLASEKERFLCFMPKAEPFHQFQVGEEVDWKTTSKCVVIETTHGGRALLIESTPIKSKMKNIRTSEDSFKISRSWVPWFRVNTMKNYNDSLNKKTYMQKTISIRTVSFTVESVISRALSFGVMDDQDYQRGNVWELEDKQSLIHSIMRNIEIGKLAMAALPFESKSSHGYEVIDGKQRLNALLEFYLGGFKYKGLTYHELNFRDRIHFDNFPLPIIELDEGSTREQRIEYFLKLNTTGKIQDKSHIKMVEELLKKELSK